MVEITQDEHFMHKALALARKGLYTAHPNPRVGCVIVKDNEIVGQGYHRYTGELHAESYALQMAGEKAKGATCYVTLEPCVHHGRTPPCVAELVQANILRVVVAMQDPNPLVNGKGIAYLQNAGLVVTIGVLEKEAKSLNQGFCCRMQKGRPYVRAKVGVSLDGAIAMASGESQWITSSTAREDVQHWRAQSGAILTGAETVLQDDPRLTVRKTLNDHDHDYDKQPLRVICDSRLRTPQNAKCFTQLGQTLVLITDSVCEERLFKERNLKETSPKIWCAPDEGRVAYQMLPKSTEGRVSLLDALESLAKREINDVLVEAGPTLLGALVQEQLVDELLCYVAPKFLGESTKSMIHLPFIKKLSQHVPMRFFEVMQMGADVRLRANFHWEENHANT